MKQKDKKLEKAQKLIGTTRTFSFNSLMFNVSIVDVRNFLGRIQYLITPIGGSGEEWVENFAKTNRWKK